MAALQGSLGLPPETPLTPAFVAAVAAMLEASQAAHGLLADPVNSRNETVSKSPLI